jgi:hypothetical protein
MYSVLYPLLAEILTRLPYTRRGSVLLDLVLSHKERRLAK